MQALRMPLKAAALAFLAAVMLADQPAEAKTKRSAKAKTEFKLLHPCPANGQTKGPCPDYVIDHIVPLKRGGADQPENMQWQTVEDAKQKDQWE
jgi:hypothetical protein